MIDLFLEILEVLSYPFKRGIKRREYQGKVGPVIGVWGWMGRSSGWIHGQLRDYFISSDVRGVLTDFGLETKNIDSYLPHLNDEVKKFPNSVIVGTSLGGLIALRYVQKYGWKNVRKVVTIVAPFNGVWMCKWIKFLGDVYTDLAPGSKFLNDLKKFKFPRGKVVQILAKWDEFVGDPEEINEPGKKYVIPVVGHNRLQNNVGLFTPLLDEILYS